MIILNVRLNYLPMTEMSSHAIDDDEEDVEYFIYQFHQTPPHFVQTKQKQPISANCFHSLSAPLPLPETRSIIYIYMSHIFLTDIMLFDLNSKYIGCVDATGRERVREREWRISIDMYLLCRTFLH